MQLDLKKIPFGRRDARHMLYEETDNGGAGWAKGLYLAYAAETAASFLGGPAPGPKGFLRMTPTAKGKDLPYSYAATPFGMTVKTAGGEIRIAADGPSVLRMEGQGVGLRLNGTMSFGGNAITTPRGAEITLGGSVYLIRTLKGRLTLDCRWQRKALRCTDPIVTVEPDETGAFALAIYDTTDAYELPALAESLDACQTESENDFRRFREGLAQPAPGFEELFNYAAYALWSGFIPFKGKELVPSNKMTDMKIYTLGQSVLALAFTDAEKALGLIRGVLDEATPQGMVPTWMAEKQNLNEAVPPLYAYAVSRLTAAGAVPREALAGLYTPMSKTVGWWLHRRMAENGLCYYAYRHECGNPKEKLFACGVPAATPDLAALIVLAAQGLSKMAESLGKTEEAASWTALSQKQLSLLTKTLWDGEKFLCVNVLTGDGAPAEGYPALIPLLLGRHLPEEISAALRVKAKRVKWEEAPVVPAALAILGLKEAGFEEDARTAANALIKSCVSGGANDARGSGIGAGALYDPAACAALLAVGTM